MLICKQKVVYELIFRVRVKDLERKREAKKCMNRDRLLPKTFQHLPNWETLCASHGTRNGNNVKRVDVDMLLSNILNKFHAQVGLERAMALMKFDKRVVYKKKQTHGKQKEQ